jgi:fructose-1,6-bisphosphatase/sedoheptulose 1,7-bisphosphatase-like protein
MGVEDAKRIYDTDDLLRGVRFFGEGVRTHSMILTLDDRQVRFVDSVHLDKRADVKVRFN